MKKFLALTATIVASTTAAHAAEANQFDGYLALGAGYNSFKLDGPTTTPDGLAVEVRGSASAPLGTNYGVQVDADFTRNAYSVANAYTLKANNSTVAAHLYWRDPAKALGGIVAQRTTTSSNLFSLPNTEYAAGGEGQFFAGKATFYGQVSYVFNDSYYLNVDGVNLGAQVRYFVKPDFSIALKGAYHDTKYTQGGITPVANNDDVHHKAWLVGGKSEYRFASSPFSLFADVDYREGKFSDSVISYKEHSFRGLVGVKLNFGPKTLFDRDRSGASLDPVRSLTPQNLLNAY